MQMFCTQMMSFGHKTFDTLDITVIQGYFVQVFPNALTKSVREKW